MKNAVLVAAVLALGGCEVNLNSEGVVTRETKRFTVSGPAEVELATFDGAIEVHSWDRDEVEIEIERRAMEQRLVEEMTVTAEQQGNRIVLKVTGPSRGQNFDGIQIGVHFSPSARLRVALPRTTQLSASTEDGSITVEDVSGRIRLVTGDGSVRGSRLNGDIHVRTGDGSIRLDRADGSLDLETDDGSITVDARASALRARTSDGSIRLEIAPDSLMSSDWDVQTSDGAVVLALPRTFNGILDAETGDGVVRVSHPAIATDEERDNRREQRRLLKATLGSGGHTVRVRTGDGSIRIE